jgi:hypothetical protein
MPLVFGSNEYCGFKPDLFLKTAVFFAIFQTSDLFFLN